MNNTFPLRIYLKCCFFLSFWRFSGRKYKHIAVHKCYQSRQKTVPDQPAAIWLGLVIVQALLQQGRKQNFIHFLPLRCHRCYRCRRHVRCGHSYPSGKWLSNMQSQSWTLPSQGIKNFHSHCFFLTTRPPLVIDDKKISCVTFKNQSVYLFISNFPCPAKSFKFFF